MITVSTPENGIDSYIPILVIPVTPVEYFVLPIETPSAVPLDLIKLSDQTKIVFVLAFKHSYAF